MTAAELRLAKTELRTKRDVPRTIVNHGRRRRDSLVEPVGSPTSGTSTRSPQWSWGRCARIRRAKNNG